MTTPPTQRKLKNLVKRLRTFDTGYLDIPLSALDLLNEAEMALAAIAEARDETGAKLAQAEAQLQAYHALHDMLSEMIEDPDSAALTQGSERRARIVEKLTSIPR